MDSALNQLKSLPSGRTAGYVIDLTALRKLPPPMTSIERLEFHRIANANGLASLVHRLLIDLNGQPELRSVFEEAANIAALRRLRLRAELVRVLSSFANAGLPVLPLKGPILSELHYGEPRIRDFGDLDILVRPNERVRAMAVMHELGYSSPYKNVDLDQRYHIVYRRGDSDDYIELHWRIAGCEYPRFKSGDFLWENSQTRSVCGIEALVPKPEATLLYLCVHAYKHDWSRLQWIRDIHQLIRYSVSFDWDTFWRLASAQHASRLAQASLQLARDFFPDAHYFASGTYPERRLLGSSQLQLVLEGLFEASPPPRKISRLLRLRWWLVDGWIDRLRLIRAKVRPSDRDRDLVILPRHLRPLYWLLRPYRVARDLIAQKQRR